MNTRIDFVQDKISKKRLSIISKCISKDISREVLTMVEVKSNNDKKLRFTATNSYGLATFTIDINEVTNINKLFTVQAIKNMADVKVGDLVCIEISGGEVKCGGINNLIEFIPLDKPYPDWEGIVSKNDTVDVAPTNSISFNTEIFYQYAQIMLDEKYTWEFKNNQSPMICQSDNAMAMVMPVRE